MAAHQTPPSLGFSRQEHWSGLPFPSPMHESESEVAESRPNLSDPMDFGPPGSSRRRQWQPTPVLLPGKSQARVDGGAWWAEVHGVAKSWTRLSDFTFTFHLPALEKEMATHSSVLAWRIPETGEPGGLPSMGSQSQTRLKQLSSSSSSITGIQRFSLHTNQCVHNINKLKTI